MDNELRHYLEGMEKRIAENVREEVRASEQRTVKLITEIKESLEREIQTMGERLGVMSSRLDKTVASAQVVARLFEWSEKQDKFLEEFLQKFHALEERVRKLDGK